MSDSGIATRVAYQIDFDLLERYAILTAFAVFAYRSISSTIESGAYVNLLLLSSEAAMAFFTLVRRRSLDISRRGLDWAAGFAATLAPLMVMPVGGNPLVPMALCAALLMLGFTLQMWAKLTLRRSFGIVAANRGVKVSGPYRIVRHPMYAGYTLTHIGFLLAGPNLWNCSLYAFALCLQIVRIRAEERILTNDAAYRSLKEATRYRLLPLVF